MSTKKYANKKLLLSALLLASSIATAGTVTIPNTFTSGTAAVAAQVNGNFTAVKTAVDDNNGRITANTGKSTVNETNISTNTAAITNLQTPTGFISVSAQAFRDEDAGKDCRYRSLLSEARGFYVAGGAQDCDLVAHVQLPHGVVVKSLTCYAFDNVTGNLLAPSLRRTSFTAFNVQAIFTTPTTIDSTSRQTLTDTTATSVTLATVDNVNNSYFIAVGFGAATDVDELSIFGCSIAY